MKTFCLILLSSLISPIFIHAQEVEDKPSTGQEKMEKIDEDRYRIGDVTIDKKTREIRFPAVVNLKDGLLEYVIVHENGKVHEALFRTSVSPTNINLAFTLLRYKPSKELYRIPKEPGVLTGDFFKEPEAVRLSSRIRMDVEFEKDGEKKRFPVSDWIRHDTTGTAMPPSYWIYGGSEFYDGKFVPESTGDIAAIYLSNSSLINYPGEDNFDDEVWSSFSARIPDLDTKVTLIFAPFEEKP